MRYILGLLIALFSMNIFPQARAPYTGMCQFSFHSDSYGRGVASAFKSLGIRAQFHDEACYQLGHISAEKMMASNGHTDCRGEFEAGYRQGFLNSSLGAGVACYNLGFLAGRAALGTGAREGLIELVGEKCVRAYIRGQNEAKQGPSSAAFVSESELYCYGLGQYEAELF